MRWCDAFGNEQDAVTMMVLRVEEESSSTRIVTGAALFERAMLGFAKIEVHFVSSFIINTTRLDVLFALIFRRRI